MFYMRLIITFTSFALSLIAASGDDKQIPENSTETERRAASSTVTAPALELNSAQLVSIGKAMTTCYQDFLKSRTIHLPKTSKAFDFFVHKKGKKYKIAKDGILDLLKLDRFINCLSDDIGAIETLHTTISGIFLEHTDDASAYLIKYGLEEQSNVEEYLSKSRKNIDKLKVVKDELKALSNQEKESRTRDLTFEMAMQYFPEELNARPAIRILAEAYIRENFFAIA